MLWFRPHETNHLYYLTPLDLSVLNLYGVRQVLGVHADDKLLKSPYSVYYN